MSLLDVTPEVMSLLRTGPHERATIADIYLDGETLHYSDLFHPITFDNGDGVTTYLPLGDRILPPDETELQTSLDESSFDIRLDSSRISDDTDPIGALVDAQLSQRRIRLRTVLFQPGTGRTVPLWLTNTRNGVINGERDRMKVGDPSILTLSISSGFFTYLERRNSTYSDTDQQAMFAGDTAFSRTPQLVDYELPWRGEFKA